MVTTASLKDQLDARIREIEQAVSGTPEEKASQAPEGEWCAKEVLTHLAGSEAESFFDGVRLFVEEDTPQLGTTPGDPYFTGNRPNASVDELLAAVTRQYRELATWVGGLTEEQLSRKAHAPAFKETPLTEYPTLQLWLGAIINYHLPAHIQQLQVLCK
jgi:hypothetical protein